MTEIDEEQLAWWETDAKRDPQFHSDKIQLRLISEIHRLREVIRKRNHCVDCGKLNPIDNVCDDCLEEDRAA